MLQKFMFSVKYYQNIICFKKEEQINWNFYSYELTLPNMEKTTQAVKMEVKKSETVTIRASLAKLFLIGLYDDSAIRQPKAKPKE